MRESESHLTLPVPSGEFKGKIGPTAAASVADFPAPVRPPSTAPNVVLFLLDDVGFGQTSPFGGPIDTPTLDALARSGLRYTRFHTTAMCSPTRAAILTGRNHHAVANGCVIEMATGFPGYNSILPLSSATIAQILSGNGYSTAAFGKWHNTPEWELGPMGPFDRWPTGLGFEFFYGFMGADCDQYSPPLLLNTTPIESPRSPAQGYILDEDLADQAVAWLRRQRNLAGDRPFFLYYAPGTAHNPLHAPKPWIDRYADAFSHGWDEQRVRTLERQKQLGIVPTNTLLTPRPEEIPAWSSLTDTKRKLAERYQAAFAGAVSHCDHQIGRVIECIEELGQRENTLILFVVGDNGPSADGGLRGVFNKFVNMNGIVEDEEAVLARIDEIGGPGSYPNYPVGWAWAGSSPLQWFKQIASHLGGTRNGLVVSWPAGGAASGEIRTQFHHCIDIAPTILDAVGIAKPEFMNGVAQAEFDGGSLCYSFRDATAKSARRRQYFEMIGNRAIYEDGWIAAARHGPLPWQWSGGPKGNFNDDRWELYNIDADFSQATDLAAVYPDRLRMMQHAWLTEADRNGVLPLDDRRGERIAAGARPVAGGNRTTFSYYPGTIRVPEGMAPNLKGRSHRITCPLQFKSGDQGILIAAGGRFGGYVLMIADGAVRYTHNLCAVQQFDVISDPLSEGEHEIIFEFQADEPRPGAGGRARLLSGSLEIGRGWIERTVPVRYSFGDSFNVGRDTGTPVCDRYEPPFAYTGRLGMVTVEVLSELAPGERQRELETARRVLREND